MTTINLKNYMNTQGISNANSLYLLLEKSFLDNEKLLLLIDNDTPVTSSFLNPSIGLFLDNYGLDGFKNTVRFRSTKTQFERFSNYVKKYNEIFLV